MGAYLAIPDKTPAGAIIAIMEIWGVNDTMRRHAHEFAEAGFICLVPDLFWRQESGVELSDHNPDDVKKAFGASYRAMLDRFERGIAIDMVWPLVSAHLTGKPILA
jgi:carboxymethylenebutenolidase